MAVWFSLLADAFSDGPQFIPISVFCNPPYVRDRDNRRSQKVRRHKWKCVGSPRIGRDEQGQADVPRGTGDRKGGAIGRIRTSEQMAGYDCSQGEGGEGEQRRQIDLEDETEAGYQKRQCTQGHYSASNF